MPNAKELLKQASDRIEEQAHEINDLKTQLTETDEANMGLAFELDLVKKAFALVEYGIEPGFDTYSEALEKAASFEEQHGTGAMSLNKEASAISVHRQSPSLGKAASAPGSSQSSNDAETNFLNGMISIVNQEE